MQRRTGGVAAAVVLTATLAFAVAVVLAGTLAAAVLPAAATAPLQGGRYIFTSRSGATSASIQLTLADDGRELARPSQVVLREGCSPTEELDDVFPLDGRTARASRSVAVDAHGRFSHRVRSAPGSRRALTLVGGFAQRGRLAVGTARIREQRPCADLTLRFRAHLAGRPNAPRPGRWSACDGVVTGWFDFPATVSGQVSNVSLGDVYTVAERDAGCTTARELARRWSASIRCLALGSGGSCGVHGATCTATSGGQTSPLVGVACTLVRRPEAAIELVHSQPCLPPTTATAAVGGWAVNVDCEAVTGFPFDALLPGAGGAGACGALAAPGPVDCAPVAGFDCRGRVLRAGSPPVLTTTCVDRADPHRALRFTTAPRRARPTPEAIRAMRDPHDRPRGGRAPAGSDDGTGLRVAPRTYRFGP